MTQTNHNHDPTNKLPTRIFFKTTGINQFAGNQKQVQSKLP
jgi:hypothetical protein